MPDPVTKVENITVPKAKKYLGYNRVNRPLNDLRILELASEIQDGRWKTNGESIIFDRNGNLIDGQHRLNAVLIADKPIRISVCRGVDPEAIITLDTGMARSPAHTLSLHGFKDTNALAASVRLVYSYIHNGTLGSYGDNRLSPGKILELANTHKALADSLKVAEGPRQLMSRGQIAALHYLASHEYPNEATLFWRSVGTGADLSIGHPALTLRNKLSEARVRNHGKVTAFESLTMSVYCWNKFAEGRTCRVIQQKHLHKEMEIAGAPKRSIKPNRRAEVMAKKRKG